MWKKYFARVAAVIERIARFLVPVLTVIKLFLELLGNSANCNDRKLHPQIRFAR